MRVKFITNFTIISTLLFTNIVMAFDDQKSPQELIVINGEQLKDSANYTVLSRKDFINKTQTLGDLLNQINGIQIRQISGVGNPAAVSIRGSSSKQVQLYIDGQLINDGQFGGFDLNQIPVEHIQSIEVSKDQAIGTGATPIGGVIRINTYNANHDKLRISAGVGSFGTREFNVIKNVALNNANFSIAASHLASDNDYDFLVKQPVNNPSESTVEALRNNEFEKNTLALNGEFRFNSHQIRVNGQYSKQDKALPLYRNNAASNNSSLNSESKRIGFNYLYQPAQNLSTLDWLEQLEIESYIDDKQERFIDSDDGINVGLNRYESDKVNLSIKPTISIQEFTFTPFVDVNIQEFTSRSFSNGVATTCNGIGACDVKANLDRFVWGSRVDWRSETNSLSTHLLVSQLSESSDNVATNQTNGTKITNDNDFTTGEFGIKYDWNAYAFGVSLSRGVRMPTLFELYGDRGLFKGNGNLKPEESDSVSFSANYNQLKWSLNSAIYYKKIDNAIVSIFNSSGIGSYSNVSSGEITGFELQADYQFSHDITLYGTLNLVDTNNESIFVAFNNKKLPGIYHQEISGKVNYDINSQWSVNLSTEYSRGLYFNLANNVEQDSQGNGNPSDRWLTNLQANWQYEAYSLSIGVSNLFDESYQDLGNRSAQGRNFLIKFSFEE